MVTDAEDAPRLGLHAHSVVVWDILTQHSETDSLHLGAYNWPSGALRSHANVKGWLANHPAYRDIKRKVSATSLILQPCHRHSTEVQL